jgi:hypothetical protein
MKPVGELVQVTKALHGGVKPPSQKSLTSPQNSPVKPRGQLQDITTNVFTIAAVSSDVASGTKHSPPFSQRQSSILGEKVALPFFVSSTKIVILACKNVG